MSLRRIAGLAACVLLFVAGAGSMFALLTRPVPTTEEVPRTAFPLRADGWPDYPGYLESRLLAGRPLAANAFIPMLHAVGPGLVPDSDRAEVLKQLGLSAFPASKQTLVSPSVFLRQKDRAGPDVDRCDRVQAAAMMTGCQEGRWAPGSRELVERWLSQSAESLEWIGQAVDKPVLFIPVDERTRERVNVMTVVHMQRALLCQGRVRLEAGDFDGAAQAVLQLSGCLCSHKLRLRHA